MMQNRQMLLTTALYSNLNKIADALRQGAADKARWGFLLAAAKRNASGAAANGEVGTVIGCR